MRPKGYYFVKYKGDTVIAEYYYRKSYPKGWQWSIGGLIPSKEQEAIECINTDPITPEKMMAIEEIINAHKAIDCHSDAENFHLTVEDILTKHKLL